MSRVEDLEKRCAELEALSAPAIQRHYMRGYNAANARRRRYYVAERDTLSRIIDTQGADNRRLEAERDELRGELALVRLAYASVITERDRLKAAHEQAYKDWEAAAFKGEMAAREAEREACAKIAEHEAEVNHAEGRYIADIIRARAALSGEGVT